MRPWFVALALLVARAGAAADAIEVPVEVGLGPAAYFFNGAVGRDQAPHWGLKLSVTAILDAALIRANLRRVPAQYRKLAAGAGDVTISPSIFIPDALLLSPPFERTWIYGATWRPIGVRVPLVGDAGDTLRIDLNLGAILTLALLHSEAFPTTFFARPGLDVGVAMEVRFTDSFGLRAGWSSGVYIPQALGGFGVATGDASVWHLGQAWVKVCVRFPYEVRL